jgi:hypothetical protein
MLMKRREAGILTWLGISALLARPAAAAGAASPRAAGARGANQERDLLEIDPKKFSRPTAVDNKWMPLTPGKRLVYEGTTVEGRRRIPHRVIYTVTDLVKIINGIPCTVVYDVDISDGKIQEVELTFFAQDDEGNVWHLGQIREAHEEEDYIGTQAWMVGHLEGAKAGIMMLANPREGTPSYSEGFAPPPYNWDDRGRVRKLGERTTVPAGTFDNLLVIEETSDREPGAFQLKYYAQGVGTVRVGWAGNDRTKETLQLVRHVQLWAQEMDQARADALKLEERAYVYGRTQPAERRTA